MICDRLCSPNGAQASGQKAKCDRRLCKTTASDFIEVIGHAGFDFCILDMEHGPAQLETVGHLIRAAEVSGVLPIVRTRDKTPESVAQPLDLGAAGVEVPQVASAEEAKAIVAAARFVPLGHRGVCRFVRAAKFSAMRAPTTSRKPTRRSWCFCSKEPLVRRVREDRRRSRCGLFVHRPL
jgi:hypothetical protein